MTPNLVHLTQMAKQHPKLRFNSLMGMLPCKDGLRASFGRQPTGKAVGVDGVKIVGFGPSRNVGFTVRDRASRPRS